MKIVYVIHIHITCRPFLSIVQLNGAGVTLLHGDPGTRRGLSQTGFLMLHRRRRHRNTGKDIDTGLDVDINISVDMYNNQQETRGRTDY